MNLDLKERLYRGLLGWRLRANLTRRGLLLVLIVVQWVLIFMCLTWIAKDSIQELRQVHFFTTLCGLTLISIPFTFLSITLRNTRTLGTACFVLTLFLLSVSLGFIHWKGEIRDLSPMIKNIRFAISSRFWFP